MKKFSSEHGCLSDASAPGSIERLETQAEETADVITQWGVRVPLRDGVHLNATVYLPAHHVAPAPAIFTLTPYIGQMWHDRGLFFASRGFPFLTVDVRGRGDSDGFFRPLINEAQDGFDVVQWLARQRYCNGKVAMWGGSYGGYVQWATLKECPPNLATIAPVASVHPGVDFPIRGNIARPYVMQWLTFVCGRTLQDRIFADQSFWRRRFRSWFESGATFKSLDTLLGNPSAAFQEWAAHPEQGAYWSQHNPTAEQYARVTAPVLTITGIYDADQPGALAYYRQHLQYGASETCSRHYLVIGPWDHAGTRDPTTEFCGLHTGPASLLDLNELHLQWYAWTMRGGPRPEFLRKHVAYYVMGAEEWRYADTLDAITARAEALYLQSTGNPTDVFNAGTLSPRALPNGEPDHYVYDPRDVGLAGLESTVDPLNRADQRMIHACSGKHLVYHSAPFAEGTEVSGFFRFIAWVAIDQPDTDFRVSVYDIGLDGSSVLLSSDSMRARYREGLRDAKLIRTTQSLCYEFQNFTFVSRLISAGHRLRLVFGPINSIYSQKNYNSGGVVSEETMQDARSVTVELFHDEAHPSVLHVPIGRSSYE